MRKQVFPLANASELGCRIDRYTIGHCDLFIRVMGENKLVCYLLFTNVQYLAVPTGWFSADFVQAPFSECQNLLTKLGYPAKLSDETHFALYEVMEPDFTIQILCGAVERLSYDPFTMKWIDEEE